MSELDDDCHTTAFEADILFPPEQLFSAAPIPRTIIEPDSARISRTDSSSDTAIVRLDSTQVPPFWAEAVVYRKDVRDAIAGVMVALHCRSGRLSVRPNRVQAHLTPQGLVYFSEKPMVEHPFADDDSVCYARVRLPQAVMTELASPGTY